MDGNSSSATDLGNWLSYGAIGLGLALFVVFVYLIIKTKTGPIHYIAAFICLFIFAGGVFLEHEKENSMTPDELKAHAGACINDNGTLGSVVLTLGIFNNTHQDGYHGYSQEGLVPAGRWVISTTKLGNISSSSRLDKRFAAKWRCD